LSVAESSAQCSDVDAETTFLNVNVRPGAGDQFLLGDHLTRTIDQGNQDLSRQVAETDGPVAFKQQLLRRKKAEWSERNNLIGHRTKLARVRLAPCQRHDPVDYSDGLR
jgi:hypothetical protein